MEAPRKDEQLILTLDEYVESITNDTNNMHLTVPLRSLPLFFDPCKFFKALHSRVLYAKKNYSLTDMRAKIIFLRVTIVIKKILETFSRFNMEIIVFNNAIVHLQNVIDEFQLTSEPGLQKMHETLEKVVRTKIYKTERVMEYHNYNRMIPRIVPGEPDLKSALLEISLEEVARQITLIDRDYYASFTGLGVALAIHQKNVPWMPCDHQPLREQAKNLENYIQNTHKLTNMVIGTVLNSKTLQECQSKVDQILTLATTLKNMNNLNSYKAVIDGLYSRYIRSLNVFSPEKRTQVKHAFEKMNDCKEVLSTIRILAPPMVLPIDYSCSIIAPLVNKMNEVDLGDKVDFNIVLQLDFATSEMDLYKHTEHTFEPVTWLQDKIRKELNIYKEVEFADLFAKLRTFVDSYEDNK